MDVCETVGEYIPLVWGYCGINQVPGGGACAAVVVVFVVLAVYLAVEEYAKSRRSK